METNSSSALISCCQPSLMISLRNDIKLAQDYCFDIEPSPSHMKFNYIDSTIHHCEVTSKNVSNTRSLRTFTHLYDNCIDRTEKSLLQLEKIIRNARMLKKFRLELKECSTKEESLVILFRSFKSTPHLQSMTIKITFMNELDFDKLVFAISDGICAQTSLELLKILFFGTNSSNNVAFLSLIKSIKNLQNMKRLTLNFRFLFRVSDIIMYKMAKSLSNMTKMQSLGLVIGQGNSKLSENGISALALAIGSLKFLEKFKINFDDDYNQKGDYSSIFDHFSSLKNLKHINVNINQIISNPRELASLSHGLEKSTQLLELLLSLRLGSNKEAISEMINLAKALGRLRNLRLLKFSLQPDNHEIQGVMKQLAESIKNFKKLEELKFVFFGSKNFENFLENLQHLSSLKIISLKSYQDGFKNIEHTKALADSLLKLINLKSISFSLEYCGMNYLLSYIKRLQNLENLMLYISSPQNLKAFPEFLKVSNDLSRLKKLGFSFRNCNYNNQELKPLSDSLGNLLKVEELHLNFSFTLKLTEDFYLELFKSVAKLTYLEKFYFNLSGNKNYTDKTVLSLNDLLLSLPNLKQFRYYISTHDTKINEESLSILKKHTLKTAKSIYADLNK